MLVRAKFLPRKCRSLTALVATLQTRQNIPLLLMMDMKSTHRQSMSAVKPTVIRMTADKITSNCSITIKGDQLSVSSHHQQMNGAV